MDTTGNCYPNRYPHRHSNTNGKMDTPADVDAQSHFDEDAELLRYTNRQRTYSHRDTDLRLPGGGRGRLLPTTRRFRLRTRILLLQLG
jgi:hypothetical protein